MFKSNGSSIHQVPESDFPADVLKWMRINLKANGYAKMAKSCSYFKYRPSNTKQLSVCESFSFIYALSKTDGYFWKDNAGVLADLSLHPLICIKSSISIYFGKHFSFIKTLCIDKIAICTAKVLRLYGKYISWKELNMISTICPNVEFLYFSNVLCVVDEDYTTNEEECDEKYAVVNNSMALAKMIKIFSNLKYSISS